MPFLIMLMFLLWIVGFYLYLSKLKQLDKFRKKIGCQIFGYNYSSLSAMGSDTHFLNSLWSGKGIQDHNEELAALLCQSRNALRLQVFYSIALFIFLFLTS